MSDYIPEEIVVEILKRLSIEDAVRCIAVCKSWYSLITSPSFISLHSQQIASNTKGLALFREFTNRNKEVYSLHFDDDDETFERYKPLDCPVASVDKCSFFRVVGCVNGVVCLSDEVSTYRGIIHLWNPSIGKCVTLPYPDFAYPTHGCFKHSVGFGFDATTNDFKVVRVVYLKNRGFSITPPKVDIYEPNVGSWREDEAKGFNWFIEGRSPQVFFHGNVHWVIHGNMIVSFDLRTEEFRDIDEPESLCNNRLILDICLSVLGESLALIHDTSHSFRGNSCCIWVMKHYGVPDSWTKLFTIDVVGRFWWVFGFRRNGEALVKVSSTFLGRGYVVDPYRTQVSSTILGRGCVFDPYHTHQNLLVALEPKSSQGKLLTEFGNWTSLYVDTFVESLALLGVKGKSADMISADEDSCDSDDASRFLEPSNPSEYNSMPLGEYVVSWLG